MLYVVIGFGVIAATILAHRFAAVWRRESARVDGDARTLASRTELHSSRR
jgi:hypothetical protein